MTVHEDDWQRQQAPDGRTYYFNRNTGASQWHLPNELYTSQRGKAQPKEVRFPTEAAAMLHVNCVTEVLPKISQHSTSTIVPKQFKLKPAAPKAASGKPVPAEIADFLDNE